MTTFGIRTANPRDALEIIAAHRKALAQLLDALKAVLAVGRGVLLIVLLAEVVEVAFEDGVEVVVVAWRSNRSGFRSTKVANGLLPNTY
jgi:hypothetical protein